MNQSKIRCEPYKINYLICVYKFCKNAKFVKLKLRKNVPVYGIHDNLVDIANSGIISVISYYLLLV